MKTILGLDLGTNSIGWALVQQDFANEKGNILGMGSRIIPMSQDILGDFGKGNAVSQTAERTRLRSVRRLRERQLLRRERLHRVLNILNFLPKHYAAEIDFKNRLGKFLPETEPKLAYEIQNTQAGNKPKSEFLFKKSFSEMLNDFRLHQPQLLKSQSGEERSIPYDWTIYYLRKKALTQRIEKEELAWILLNFNQKRGYYQLRGEDDEDATRTLQTRTYFITETIVELNDSGSTFKGLKVIQLKLSNGETGKYFSRELPDWKGQMKNIIATIDLDKEGNDRFEDDGNIKRRFSIPTEEDWDKKWKLVKIKTENEIQASGKTVGAYIYESLLQNPSQKLRGKLVRTIERKYYKDELARILKKQTEYHPELQDSGLYAECVRELYKHNLNHQFTLSKKNFEHLLLEDIIFFQRSLRSQKSLIENCPLECHKFRNKDGEIQTQYLKVIPKSNPYYQEFRIWQWVQNLSIYRKEDDTNVTAEFLKAPEDIDRLFEFLMDRKEVDNNDLLKHLLESRKLKPRELKAEINKYRWNYVYDSVKDESKKYPCNETGYELRSRLKKVKDVPDNFLTREREQQLWHIIYSVTDKSEYEKALKSFALKYNLNEFSFFNEFAKFPPFKSDYGSFSEKAIKKLLPLMRTGKHWTWEAVDNVTKISIGKIITGEYDSKIKDRVRDKAMHLTEKNHFQGLQLWLAQYIVYGRHSESGLAGRWNSAQDLQNYLDNFKQHTLRNPIVEQVITETLRVVKDIWLKYGKGAKNFFDEMHIELGREMKNNADDRKRLSNIVTENENTNIRIKALLAEMALDTQVQNVRPFSPMHQEILKIYEEGALNSENEIDDYILKISKTAQPSSVDLRRYKLWLEQKYRSPYTGEIIPLNRLFTPEFEIEHIIPQSRYFDDSFSNKVICEAQVNKLKDNQLGWEFIRNHHGTILECGPGSRSIRIFDPEEYKEFVNSHYSRNRAKRSKLLLEDLPEQMIERQLNDTRYISKFISSLLSNIVRADNNDDGPNSKNIIPGNGKITSALKQDWGLNDVWNQLILPRFERLNSIAKTTHFTTWNENHQKFLPVVPLEIAKGFSKKRIDHRHHALDALVIACANRNHVNYMNNEHALRKGKSLEEKQNIRFDLRASLCIKKYNEGSEKNYHWVFKKPWASFTLEAKECLDTIIISFKQNLRIINKATNQYESYRDENGMTRTGKNGSPEKCLNQQKGTNWAIRKSLHKDTVSGKVELPRIKVPRGKFITATRKSIDTSFDLKTIESVTDTGIQKILRNYLLSRENNPELAFSPEGIEYMNKHIMQYNDGKWHQPILKVRIFEIGSKFPLGSTGNKTAKYVEADKGTNLFFAVYQNEFGKRNYESVPLNLVVERQKQGLPPVPLENEKGDKLIFHLSPHDLVYLPTEDERENKASIDISRPSIHQVNNIYKVVSFTGSQVFFVRHEVAAAIVNKVEFSPLNKMERALDGTMIKEICIKLVANRLGDISIISNPVVAHLGSSIIKYQQEIVTRVIKKE